MKTFVCLFFVVFRFWSKCILSNRGWYDSKQSPKDICWYPMLDGSRGDGTGELMTQTSVVVLYCWRCCHSRTHGCTFTFSGARLWFQSGHMELWNYSHRASDRLCTLSSLPPHEGESFRFIACCFILLLFLFC